LVCFTAGCVDEKLHDFYNGFDGRPSRLTRDLDDHSSHDSWDSLGRFKNTSLVPRPSSIISYEVVTLP
jgi:hypothetical protein